MDCPKICQKFANSCIWQFKKKGAKYVEVLRQENGISLYDLAKQHETKTRNLQKALALYARAALHGQKVNSCIKDFASVLHQSGYTLEAIKFLEEMRPIYKGDAQKYQKLILNLSSQLLPTGKHEYKNILIDLIDIKLENPERIILEMFGNYSRIKNISFYQNLGFKAKVQNGRYIVIQFDSFSAAKKTIETFKQDEWFGVNRYWLDIDFCIVAESVETKTDFDRGFLLNKGKIQKIEGKYASQSNYLQIKIPNFKQTLGYEGLELINETSIYLIQNYQVFSKKEQ